MASTHIAILALSAWAVLLALGVILARNVGLAESRPDGRSTFLARLTRAHANCYEFLPFALAVMLFAVAVDREHATDSLALFLVAARIAQSTVHMISVTQPAILVRLALFLVQCAIVLIWCFGMLAAYFVD